jgi:hypothetical protein
MGYRYGCVIGWETSSALRSISRCGSSLTEPVVPQSNGGSIKKIGASDNGAEGATAMGNAGI